MSQFIPSDSVWKLRLDSKGDCPFAFIDLLSRSCYFVVIVLVLFVSQWIHVCFCVLTPSRFSCKYLLVSSFVKCIVCLLSPVCYFHLWLVPFFVSHCPVLVWSSILLACVKEVQHSWAFFLLASSTKPVTEHISRWCLLTFFVTPCSVPTHGFSNALDWISTTPQYSKKGGGETKTKNGLINFLMCSTKCNSSNVKNSSRLAPSTKTHLFFSEWPTKCMNISVTMWFTV